jgi:uncharacterized protein (DUF362 family)
MEISAEWTRRKMLTAIGAAAGGLVVPRAARGAFDLPTSPVALARCRTYGSELLPALATMFDQLGGLGRLVAGKTVAIKVNLVSNPWSRLDGAPVELTHWTHPAVIGATVYLLGRAGASRIRVLECCNDSTDPMADFLRDAEWNPNDILNAAQNVEFENTNGVGSGTSYSRVWCPNGGLVFPGYDINHSYVDCDVLVSLAKMKEHHWFGVTLSMKNIYGMTPLNIYGDYAGEDEPSIAVKGTRVTTFHNGIRAPSRSAPQEIDPESPREGGYRIPRIVAEINSARPIHLAILDGVESMAGGEAPFYAGVRRVSPGVLVAGFNSVTTDAVAMAVMGFDPMADRGAAPFEDCDSFIRFAEELGLGTRDLSRIEVLGSSIEELRFDFRKAGLPPV